MKGSGKMIGNIIKHERKKQGMKQGVLAKGICSPSYLCKIENNQVESSSEILSLLLERLNIKINISEKNSIDNIDYRKELLEIYEEVRRLKSIKLTQEKYNDLLKKQSRYSSRTAYCDYKLVVLNMLLMLHKTSPEIERELSLFNNQESDLDNLQLYLYKKCMAIHHYHNHHYELASLIFDQTILIYPQRYFDDFEKADLNYMNALAKLANNQYLASINEIKLSTNYFIDNLMFTRVIECLLVEGISYQKVQNLNKSQEIYLKALKFSMESNNEKYNAIIYQNLGSVTAAIGDLNLSLEYYLNSLDLKVDVEDQLLTIFSIIQVYSRKMDKNNMQIWLEKGLKLIENKKNLQSYYYHFNIYKQLFLQFNDLKFLNSAIKYFEDIKDYRHTYKYGIKVAELLKLNGKYKQASEYFEKSISYKNYKILHWEDL